jgi:outer membrane protein
MTMKRSATGCSSTYSIWLIRLLRGAGLALTLVGALTPAFGVGNLAGGPATTPAATREPTSSVATNATVLVETLSLEQAYDRALATDQSIRIAYEQVRQARLLPWSALTRLGTRLTGTANYNKPKDDIVSPFGPIVTETKSAAITVEQPLIDLTVFPAYRYGKLSAQSARLAQRFTVRNVLFGVTQAYYNALQQQQICAVDRQTLDLANQQLTFAQQGFDAGVATRTDVLRARVSVEQAQRALTEDEDALRLARHVLNSILNFSPDRPLLLIEPPSGATNLPPVETLLTSANQHREDLQVSQLAVQQSIQQHRQVAAQYGPLVVAQWSNEWITPETFSQHNDFWTAGVGIRIPFFEGGQRELDLRRTDSQTHQARLETENLGKSIEIQVREAWLRVHTLARTLETLRAEVAADEENYRDLQNEYRAGTATSLDVSTALTELQTASTKLATQTEDYQVALRNLEVVQGVFQQARVEKLNTP